MSEPIIVEGNRTTARFSRDENRLEIDCRPTGLARLNVTQAKIIRDFLDREIPILEAATYEKNGQQNLFAQPEGVSG